MKTCFVAASLLVCAAVTLTVPAQSGGDGPKAPPASPKVEKPASAPTALTVGSAVDGELKLVDIDGKTHTMSEYRGKVVVISFWSILCPYLKVAEPKLKEFQADYAKKDVVLLAINANDDEIGAAANPPVAKDAKSYPALRAHIAKAKVEFPVFVDVGNKVADVFGAKSTPHCFVIDKAGVLRYAGALDDDPKGAKGKEAQNYIRAAADALLAGAEVKVNTTKQYG